MMIRTAIVLGILLMSNLVAQADLGVGLKLGTLGVGVDATVGVSERVNARLSGNYLSLDFTGFVENDDEDGNNSANAEEIELNLDLQSFSALLDFHPWDGAFRISAGAVLNNNEVSLSADLDRSVEIGDQSFRVDSFDGAISFSDIAPYIGIGFGNALDQEGRWTFAMDVGVMFQGDPEVDLKATASNQDLQDALNAALQEEAATLEEDTEALSVYPVISLGLAYRF